jgi:hypothetical protein
MAATILSFPNARSTKVSIPSIPGTNQRPDVLLLTIGDLPSQRRGELTWRHGKAERTLWYETQESPEGALNWYLYGLPMSRITIYTNNAQSAFICQTCQELVDELFFLWWGNANNHCRSCFYDGDPGLPGFNHALNAGVIGAKPFRISGKGGAV